MGHLSMRAWRDSLVKDLRPRGGRVPTVGAYRGGNSNGLAGGIAQQPWRDRRITKMALVKPGVLDYAKLCHPHWIRLCPMRRRNLTIPQVRSKLIALSTES